LDFEQVFFPPDVAETLSAIYRRAVKLNPGLDKEIFLREIIIDWLNQYELAESLPVLTKSKVCLRNNLKQALRFCDKTITEVAATVGIDRVHLSHIVNGKSDPSVTVALLLERALSPLKLKDIFYLEPVE